MNLGWHLVCAVMCLLSLPAQAETNFCNVLANLKAAAGGGDIEDQRIALPDAKAPIASCTLAEELGGVRSVFCSWVFTYRSVAAERAFDRLNADIATCKGDPVSVVAPVNHPDSYRLLTCPSDMSVGLKDKASLQQTHVILRVAS